MILIEKREMCNWGMAGLWPPIGLTKISKMGEGYGQMSINDFLAHFTLLGCKGG